MPNRSDIGATEVQPIFALGKLPSGYKVIFVPFENGQAKGKPIDVLTGFLNE